MSDIREIVTAARKKRGENSDSPEFVSGDVAGGVVREAEVKDDTEEKTDNDQQEG